MRVDMKPDSKTQVFNNEERELLVKQAWEDYYHNPENVEALMILLCNQTGVRNGELVALKPTDLSADKIRIQRQEIKYHDDNGNLVREVVEGTKSIAGTRDIPLNESAKEILKHLPKDGKYLFEIDGKRVTTSMTDAYIRRLCKRIGIPVRGMHKIRKTFISKLFEVNLHPEKVREISGHDDMQTLYKNYCFCTQVEEEINQKINKAS